MPVYAQDWQRNLIQCLKACLHFWNHCSKLLENTKVLSQCNNIQCCAMFDTLCLDTFRHSQCSRVFDTLCVWLPTYSLLIVCCILRVLNIHKHTPTYSVV